MSFTHACFISYRNGDRNDKGLDSRSKDIEDTINAFARDLRDELKRELITRINSKPCLVFLDQDTECIKKGDPLLKKLSDGVCKSVCMVVIFTPHYLNKDKLICAAELEGMLRRLKDRCGKLNIDETQAIHWVFTAVFREPDRVPEILNVNLRFDFTAYESSSTPLRRHPGYLKQIQDLAETIAKRWEEMEELNEASLTNDCNNFNILDPVKNEQDLLDFVKQHRKPVKLNFART